MQGLFAGLRRDRVLAYHKDGTPVYISVHEPDVDLAKVKLHLDDGSRLTKTKAQKLADDLIGSLSARRHSREYDVDQGQKLRTLRKQRGLTTLDVEKISGGDFKHSALANYERGYRVISETRLYRLAQLYDVPVHQLLPRPLALQETPFPRWHQGFPPRDDPGRRFRAWTRLFVRESG